MSLRVTIYIFTDSFSIKIIFLKQGSENKRIFALGDCADIKEEKLALKCEKHAAVVVHNICQMEKNKTNFKQYKPSSFKLMIASIGRDNGVFQLSNLGFSGCVPALIKSKTLFIPRYKKTMGYQRCPF